MYSNKSSSSADVEYNRYPHLSPFLYLLAKLMVDWVRLMVGSGVGSVVMYTCRRTTRITAKRIEVAVTAWSLVLISPAVSHVLKPLPLVLMCPGPSNFWA